MIDDALNELLSGTRTYKEIDTGLRFQFREPGEDNPSSRLLCYRVGGLPTIREFTAVRQRLEAMRPQAEIRLMEPLAYTGRDGKERRGRVFSWAEVKAIQASMFGGG